MEEEDWSDVDGNYTPPREDDGDYSPVGTPPATPDRPPRIETTLYLVTLYSTLAITLYNEEHQNDEFELEAPLCFKSFYTANRRRSNLHLNFIAKSKLSSELVLFFAACTTHTKRCLACTIVHPGNPLFQIGCQEACNTAGTIYHPSLEYGRRGLQGGSYCLDLYEESAKELLCEGYTIVSTVQELNTEDADKLKKTFDDYVHWALEKYNQENHVSFEPLETVFGVRFRHNFFSFEGVFWVHVTFKANNGIDNSPVLFFAQLGLDSDSITCVAIRNTHVGSPFPGDKTSEVCPRHCFMHHPIGGGYADCQKGTFADSLWNGRCWEVKSKLKEVDWIRTLHLKMEHSKHLKR